MQVLLCATQRGFQQTWKIDCTWQSQRAFMRIQRWPVTKKNILQHAGAALCHSAWFPTNMEIWLHMTITESFHEHAMPQVETLKGGDGGGWDACWLFNQENWCWALEVNNYKYSKIEYFRFGGVVERKIECMFKKFSYITNDAQNMDGGSTITYQSRFKICSTAIQIQLKIWTQPRRSLPNSSTAQLKVQLCMSVTSINPKYGAWDKRWSSWPSLQIVA